MCRVPLLSGFTSGTKISFDIHEDLISVIFYVSITQLTVGDQYMYVLGYVFILHNIIPFKCFVYPPVSFFKYGQNFSNR